MKPSLNILRGELERLLSNEALTSLCEKYLDIDPVQLGLFAENKATYVRSVVDYCEKQNATESLADALNCEKPGLTDPRLQHVYFSWLSPSVATNEIDGLKIGDKIDDNGSFCTFDCQSEDGADYQLIVIDTPHTLLPSSVQRFLLSCRMQNNLNADFLPQIHKMGILSDARPYLLISQLKGTKLAFSGALPPKECLNLAKSILNHLEILETNGLLHGDLRPENILLQSQDCQSLLLTGAGFDRLQINAGWLRNSAVATNMAPELFRGEGPTISSELYSLGCILYFTTTGKIPVSGKRSIDIASKHINGNIVPIEENTDAPLPAKYKAFIEGLMSKDPGNRINDLSYAKRILEEAVFDLEDFETRASLQGTAEDIEEQTNYLAQDPYDDNGLRALDEAADIYGAHNAAIDFILQLLPSIEDPTRSFILTQYAADAAWSKSRNYELAYQLYEQLAQIDPGNEDIFNKRIKALSKLGNYDAVIELLGAKAEEARDPATRMQLLLKIGNTLEKEAHDFTRAFDYYLACLSGGDSDKELVKALEKMTQKHGRLEELVQTAGNAANAAETSGNINIAHFYYDKLGRWYTQLQQPSVALTCYQKVLQLAPSDENAFNEIVNIYQGSQQWMELAQIYAGKAETESSPDSKRKYLIETARIYFERLGEINAAQELARNVLNDDPGFAPATSLIRKIYEKTQDFANLVVILEDSIKSMPAGDGRVVEQIRLGEVYENKLNNPKIASIHYAAANEEEPSNFEAINGLERVYKKLGEFSKLHDVLANKLELTTTAKQKIDILLSLASIYEDEFKEINKAVDCYRKIVQFDQENTTALEALAKHLEKLEVHDELTDILYKLAAVNPEQNSKREILTKRAKIIREELNDPARATAAFNELAELGGGGIALAQIVRCQIELGDLEAAEKTYYKMVADCSNDSEKVDTLIELGVFQLEKMKNISKAEETLNQAKQLAPQNIDVLSELAEVLSEKGDYTGALNLWESLLNMVEGSTARAKIFSKMGLTALDKIGDEAKATQYFEQTIQLDNSNAPASDKLSGIYRKKGMLQEAADIYERWIPSATTLTKESHIELLSCAAEVYEKLGRKEKAFELFKKSAELDDSSNVNKKLGEVALEMEDWELARKHFEKYATETFNDLSNDEKVELFVKRGKAALGAGIIDEAAKMARQATVMNPDDLDARILLSDIQEERKDYRGAVESKIKVIEALQKGDPRHFDIVRNCATIMFEKLRNAEGAASLLKSALKSDPKNRDLLGELLKMHYAAKKYEDVVSVILKIAELVDDSKQLSRYYLTVAKVYRRELRQLDKAVFYFQEALEQDFELHDAQNALIQVLTEQQNWETLEKVYKKMIARLPADSSKEEKMSVFEPLADLYMTKLNKEADAIVLFETMDKLNPSNADYGQKLSELYNWNTKYIDKSITLHHKLLKKNVTKVDSYRMLYRIFSAASEPDKAWCCASMLSILNQASPDERQYYKDYLSQGYPPISSTLDNDDWTRRLYHSEMNKDITNIFSAIMPVVVQSKCQAIEQTGLAQMTPVDFTQDTAEFSKLVNFGFGVSSTPPVPLYYQDNQNGFGLVDTNPAVLLAGKDAYEMRDYLGLAFRLGRQITLLRPGLFAKQILKTGTELSSWLLAAVKLHAPQLPIPPKLMGGINERLAPIRNGLNPNDAEKLQGYVQAFLSQAADVDLKRWAKSVDYTGDRLGLLLCGDVAVAMRILESDVADPKEKLERIKELSLFVVSENLFDLRKKLGVALQPG